MVGRAGDSRLHRSTGFNGGRALSALAARKAGGRAAMSALAGVEASAVTVLKRAVELDSSGRFDEAVVCYQEGIHLLLQVVKGLQDETKKQKYRDKMKDYMGRAEALKELVKQEKETGKYHEQIHIEENSTGWSYEKIFGRFLESSLTEVEVEDPYVRTTHQIYNFLRFCEVLVKSGASVKKIFLQTGCDKKVAQQQQALADDLGFNLFDSFLVNNKDRIAQDKQNSQLLEVKKSLHSFDISLHVTYSMNLHDREIRFNNGWIIKIGRGLDYYKPTGKFCIGFCDYYLRPCHQTTVDIFHVKHTNQVNLDS